MAIQMHKRKPCCAVELCVNPKPCSQGNKYIGYQTHTIKRKESNCPHCKRYVVLATFRLHPWDCWDEAILILSILNSTLVPLVQNKT